MNGKNDCNYNLRVEQLHGVALTSDGATDFRSVPRLRLLGRWGFLRSLSKLNMDWAVMQVYEGSNVCLCMCLYNMCGISNRARHVFVLVSVQRVQNPPS